MKKASPLPTWNTALHLYETTLLAAGRSTNSVRLYRHYLRQLQAVHERSPWTVSTQELRELLANPSWSSAARKSCRTAARGFYRWAQAEGLIEHDPALALLPVAVRRGVPKPTPEHIVERLVLHAPERTAFMGMLAAFCGMRVGGIACVHEDDVVQLLGTIGLVVHAKGGKEQILPIEDERLASMLCGVEGWAFPNRKGGHLSPGHVSRLMSRALPGKWTGHTLRHRCATVALDVTGDIYAVSTLLGHSRLETTQIYAGLPKGALRRVVAAASKIQRLAA